MQAVRQARQVATMMTEGTANASQNRENTVK